MQPSVIFSYAAPPLLGAFIGYLMNAYGYSVIVFVIAFFLGERFELSLSQSLNIIDGDVTILLSHPVALLLLALAAFSVYWFGFRSKPRLERVEPVPTSRRQK